MNLFCLVSWLLKTLLRLTGTHPSNLIIIFTAAVSGLQNNCFQVTISQNKALNKKSYYGYNEIINVFTVFNYESLSF